MEGVSDQDTISMARRIVDLMQAALAADEIEGFSRSVLPLVLEFAHATSGFLYLSDSRLPSGRYVDCGVAPAESATLEEACSELFDRMVDRPHEADVAVRISPDGSSDAGFLVYGLLVEERLVGLLGTATRNAILSELPDLWSGLLAALARVVDRLADQASSERKLLHLHTYLTVSSMLGKSVDLAELLEIALYCCMEAVTAEAASVLLLDDAKETFQFYHVEGPAKPLLSGSSFPMTEGVAGRVLHTLEAEIVSDAESDAQFYGQIDRQTGFRTRNMIAVPLVAGEEHVGVLEVLNKADGGAFTPDERLILVSVADEIAFAIRNASVFDYVVNTYCKRRQGQHSCKGCSRPLGSWTPCMRYREFLP